jgi:hypothetical protein
VYVSVETAAAFEDIGLNLLTEEVRIIFGDSSRGLRGSASGAIEAHLEDMEAPWKPWRGALRNH